MRSQLAVEDFYSHQILFEELRSRCARLESRVRLLLAVVVLLSVLALAGDFRAAGTTVEATPHGAPSPHGSYCLSDQGTVYLSSMGPETPSFREFQRFCEGRGGEVLWRP